MLIHIYIQINTEKKRAGIYFEMYEKQLAEEDPLLN